MSKKTNLIAVGCFLGGLLLGVGGTYFFGLAYWGKQTADGLTLLKDIEIVEAGQRAFDAYQRENHAVAIYALNQYLDKLRKAEEIGNENSLVMTGINFDTMLTHARLAKVYAAAGQRDLNNQHFGKALRRASQDRKLQTITNQAMLTEILARVDKGATK